MMTDLMLITEDIFDDDDDLRTLSLLSLAIERAAELAIDNGFVSRLTLL